MIDICSLDAETPILGIAFKNWLFISILSSPFASLPFLLTTLAKRFPINKWQLRAKGIALMKDPDRYSDETDDSSRLWSGSDLRSVFRDTLEVSKSAIFAADECFDVPVVVIGLLLSVPLGTLIFFAAESDLSGVFGYLRTVLAVYYSVVVCCLVIPLMVYLYAKCLSLVIAALVIARGLTLYLAGIAMYQGSHKNAWLTMIILFWFVVALLSFFSQYPPSGCTS